MRGAALCHAGKPSANLDAFDRVDAHHGVGNVGIHLVKQGLAQTHRHVGRRHADACAARVAVLAQGVHVGFQRGHISHRRKKRVGRHMLPGLKTNGLIANLRHAATKLGTVLFQQPFLGHRACRHHGRGQPR